MNVPPADAIRVAPDALRSFVAQLMASAGLERDKASVLAELLVANDLRGVFSHGSRQAATYAGLIADGRLNGQPHVRREREEEVTARFDGDGGLGYFPALEAARWVAGAARRHGTAVAVTRNHGHFGAAGIYARIVVAADLIAYVTSGHQLALAPGHTVREAAGGSPMCFAIPAGKEPPLVLDFGTMHDLYPGSPYAQAIFALAPGLVLRSIGLGMVCQCLGGFLTGVPLEEARTDKAFSGANQGSLIVAVDPTRFLPLDRLQAEMDRFHELARQMEPMAPAAPAVLPGTLEWQREREYAVAGIPVGQHHRDALAAAARRFGVTAPFPPAA